MNEEEEEGKGLKLGEAKPLPQREEVGDEVPDEEEEGVE